MSNRKYIKQVSPVGTTHDYKWLTSTIKSFSADGTRRFDLNSKGNTEDFFCVDRYDGSRVHSTYPTGYNSRCGLCYLNFGHTVDAHNQRIAAYEAQSEATKAAEEAHSWYKAVNH